MRQNKPILLILSGHTIEPVRSHCGNVDSHFAAILGENALHSYPICEDWRTKPNLADFSGVIMTGSAAMLGDDEPWMRAAKALVASCLETATPFLGVCFGHQVLGAVCGAAVGPNPNGRRNGTTTVTCTEQATLFKGLPRELSAQVSHRDVILEDLPSFKVIASAPHDSRHAIQVGQNAFGVQFHPEWNQAISSAYIEARREVLGAQLADEMAQTLKESPLAARVLLNFKDLCHACV
jgi:GMP synthase (glutamine-hydrolysing)